MIDHEKLWVMHRRLDIMGLYETQEEAEEALKSQKTPCRQVEDPQIVPFPRYIDRLREDRYNEGYDDGNHDGWSEAEDYFGPGDYR